MVAAQAESHQSLTHNLKLIFLAGQIQQVDSDACPASTDLTQITARPPLLQFAPANADDSWERQAHCDHG